MCVFCVVCLRVCVRRACVCACVIADAHRAVCVCVCCIESDMTTHIRRRPSTDDGLRRTVNVTVARDRGEPHARSLSSLARVTRGEFARVAGQDCGRNNTCGMPHDTRSLYYNVDAARRVRLASARTPSAKCIIIIMCGKQYIHDGERDTRARCRVLITRKSGNSN